MYASLGLNELILQFEFCTTLVQLGNTSLKQNFENVGMDDYANCQEKSLKAFIDCRVSKSRTEATQAVQDGWAWNTPRMNQWHLSSKPEAFCGSKSFIWVIRINYMYLVENEWNTRSWKNLTPTFWQNSAYNFGVKHPSWYVMTLIANKIHNQLVLHIAIIAASVTFYSYLCHLLTCFYSQF